MYIQKNEVELDYESPVENGIFTEFHNEQLHKKISLNGGLRDGVCEMYWPNNQLKTREFFKRGKFVGIWKKYYENGQLADTCIHENVKEGESDFLSYYPDGQKKVETVSLSENACVVKEWYPNGQLKGVNNWQNGKLHGVSEKYHENGQIACRVHYENDVLIGKCEQFSSDGALIENPTNHVECMIIVGRVLFPDEKLQNGVITKYHNGQLRQKISLTDGRLDGVQEEYYSNNQLKKRSLYQKGELVAVLESHYKSGQLAERCNLDAVQKGGVYLEAYYPNGQKMRETVYTESGISTSKEWYKTGVLQSVSNKKDGKLHGLSETYYKNGSLERQNYDDGALICAEVYSPRGFLLKRDHYQKVDESVSIQGFQRHGLYEEYDLDGELKIKCSYKNGVLDGVFKEYDYRGRIIKEVLYKEGMPVENKKITSAKDERVKKILAEMMDLSRS